jgi:ketosteroid isomerase-like protein
MVEQVIRDGTKRYVEAFNRGDAATVADFYTEDAKVLPNNMEMVSGKQAIQQLWKTAMEMGVRKMNLETLRWKPGI